MLYQTVRVMAALLVLCLSSTIALAQDHVITVLQVAPLPVMGRSDADTEAAPESIRFALTVDAACATASDKDNVVLAVADQTYTTRLTGLGSESVEIAVLAAQLTGLQVNTLCARRSGEPQDKEHWVLPGAFSAQATLVCVAGDDPSHVTAAVPLDITIDCTSGAPDALPETPESNAKQNPPPAD